MTGVAEENGRLDWLRDDLKELSRRLDEGFTDLRGDMGQVRQELSQRLDGDEKRLDEVEKQQREEKAVRKVLGAMAMPGMAAALGLVADWLRSTWAGRG